MSDITLSAAMRGNLLALQSTQNLISQTQFRLSTGKKINTAIDNPSAYFEAQALSNRASDLSALLDGISRSIQTIKAASEGIASITTLVNSAKATAETAELEATGGAYFLGTVDIDSANQADVTSSLATDGHTFTLQVGSGPITEFTISTGLTLASLIDQMNSINSISVTTEVGTLPTDLKVVLRTTNGQTLTVADGPGAHSAATDLFGATSIATHATTSAAPVNRVTLEAEYDEFLSQISDIVVDSIYQGTNLLAGDSLVTQFNEDGSSSSTITGTSITSAGLGLSSATFDSLANIQAALGEIATALATLESQTSTYGSNLVIIEARESFTKNLSAILQEGADKLILTDMNQEGANLLSLQTSHALGISALSLASEVNNDTLRLFAV